MNDTTKGMFGFKKEQKKPISFASVEMQKAPRNYIKWVVVLFSIILILTIFFWIK